MEIVEAELCLWGMFGPGVVLGAIPQAAPIALASRGQWETCARDQSLHWCTPVRQDEGNYVSRVSHGLRYQNL